ncbi:Pectinesterase 1 [Platanthera guangdongensis]|uniref:Pectinesterase 1 n=1 Tax=Platanthera guangdongensis TaxID=2320717 RepID=A0ABR2LQC5_9ASPA
MDTLNSFKGYGKMDPAADRAFRRKTRRRIILIAVTAVLLVAIVATVATVLTINKRNSSHDNHFSPQSPISTSSSIRAVCSVTRYPNSCYDSISAASANSTAVNPAALFNLSLSVASRALSKLPSFLSTFNIPAADKRLQAAVQDCRDLIDDAIDRLNESALDFGKIGDLKTWLSATIADQETCLDGFEGTSGGFREKLESAMANSTQFASNSLAIVARIMGIIGNLHFPINRKLVEVEGTGGSIFPEWASEGQRRILQGEETAFNATVALDGTGNVSSVQEAVDMVPRRSLSPFVIHIKAGEYKEAVVVDKNKWNVVMIGDGMYKTIITDSKNFIDGTPTFSTATFCKFWLVNSVLFFLS